MEECYPAFELPSDVPVVVSSGTWCFYDSVLFTGNKIHSVGPGYHGVIATGSGSIRLESEDQQQKIPEYDTVTEDNSDKTSIMLYGAALSEARCLL